MLNFLQRKERIVVCAVTVLENSVDFAAHDIAVLAAYCAIPAYPKYVWQVGHDLVRGIRENYRARQHHVAVGRARRGVYVCGGCVAQARDGYELVEVQHVVKDEVFRSAVRLPLGMATGYHHAVPFGLASRAAHQPVVNAVPTAVCEVNKHRASGEAVGSVVTPRVQKAAAHFTLVGQVVRRTGVSCNDQRVRVFSGRGKPVGPAQEEIEVRGTNLHNTNDAIAGNTEPKINGRFVEQKIRTRLVVVACAVKKSRADTWLIFHVGPGGVAGGAV
ncbi:MAG: hypothetical protein DRQ48_00030 [Gammaproteobacteria bacterium]|nr:MAG: hypothetical protein DRQ48_00030 [Gammaproteobacteria bacterium]